MYSYNLSQKSAEKLSKNPKLIWEEVDKTKLKGSSYYYMTLDEVAREMRVSRERVRQIEQKALNKLRHPKRSANLKQFL